MASRVRVNSDWNLDFGENVVPISSAPQRAAGRPGPNTLRGLPRVIPPTDPGLAAERPLVRTPPGRVHKLHPLADPQTEATLEFEMGSLPRRMGRRGSHADLDLQLARHEDPEHLPTLAVMSAQRGESWHTWLAFFLGAAGTGALLVWFFR